jgi:hypothetical protein
MWTGWWSQVFEVVLERPFEERCRGELLGIRSTVSVDMRTRTDTNHAAS